MLAARSLASAGRKRFSLRNISLIIPSDLAASVVIGVVSPRWRRAPRGRILPVLALCHAAATNATARHGDGAGQGAFKE